MADRFRVVPASYVFLLRAVRGDEVLLQLRRNTGYMDGHWAAAAAGHVERGETAYDAARREAREEIDVDDLVPRVRHLHAAHPARRPDRRARRLLLQRTRMGGLPRIVEPAKCAALSWFALTPSPTRSSRTSGSCSTPGGGPPGVHHLRLLTSHPRLLGGDGGSTPPRVVPESSAAIPERALLLHIGPHKTGTTAIQGLLAAARDDLAAHGVTYPGGPAPTTMQRAS